MCFLLFWFRGRAGSVVGTRRSIAWLVMLTALAAGRADAAIVLSEAAISEVGCDVAFVMSFQAQPFQGMFFSA